MRKYAVLKLLSVGLVIIWGFLQPAAFHKFLSEKDFAFLTIFYGYGLFLDFFDFGVNKPVYARLRRDFVEGQNIQQQLIDILQLYLAILAFMVSVFAGFMFFSSYHFDNQLTKFVVVLLAINICLTVFFNYSRNLLFAIDEFVLFERLDIARKFLNVVSIFLLAVDGSYLLTVLANLLGFGFIFGLILQKIATRFGFSLSDIFQTLELQGIKRTFWTYAHEAKYSFAFTFNANMTFNIGFLLFPLFLSSREIIQFGLWYKITYGTAMFIVAFSDLSLHHITRFYITGKVSQAFRYFLLTIAASLLSVTAMFVVFYLFKAPIFRLWVDSSYEFDGLITLSLLIFFVGRSFEYVSSTILLSLGGFFRKATVLSSFILALCFVLLFSLLYLGKSLSLILIIFSLVVLLNGLMYLAVLSIRFTSAHES